MFKAALFTIANTWKQPKCPSLVKWIKKMWCIYTLDYYSATKKNKIMPFTATRMQLEIIMPSVSERERQIPYDITYIQNRKYDTNELVYEREANYEHREQTCSCQGEGIWGRDGLRGWC